MEMLPLVVNLIAVLFICALVTACTRERPAVAVDQQNDPDQTGHVHTKRAKGQQPVPWTGIVAALSFVFSGAMVFGYLNKWDAASWTALFSLALVACTIAQGLFAKWQREIMQDGLGATQIAAGAAKVSADVAVQTMHGTRPWLCTDSLKIILDAPTTYFSFDAKNLGRIPAEVVAFDHDCFVVSNDDTLNENIRNKINESATATRPQRRFYALPDIKLEFVCDFGLTASQLAEIRAGSKVFVVVIILEYKAVGSSRTPFMVRECLVYDLVAQDVRLHSECNYMD